MHEIGWGALVDAVQRHHGAGGFNPLAARDIRDMLRRLRAREDPPSRQTAAAEPRRWRHGEAAPRPGVADAPRVC
jgi:hypothetical protein